MVADRHVPFAVHIPAKVSTPFVHDWPAPHSVPAPLLPVSVQTDVPVEHDVAPVLQAFVGWQLAPAAHETHVPALQTLSVPQLTPFARALPESVQPMLGEQTVMPP